MANRVPLIADSSTLFLKELPSGDALDLTGCSIVGLTSFTPGTGGGYGFIGITTFGDGTGAATTGVYVNDGLLANYLKASNLTADRVVLTGAGGTLTDSSDLTFSASTLTAANVTITGDTNLGNASGDTITATGSFDSHLIPASDGDKNLGSSSNEWGDLYIDGTANIDALVADSAKISDLTDNRVVIAGSAGELEDSGNLTFDGSTLTVTGDLAVSGSLNYTNVTDIYSVGVITAASNVQVGAGISVVGVSTFSNEVGVGSAFSVTGVSTFSDSVVISGGTLKIPTVAGTNTDAALNILFQTGTGVIDGGSSLTFNPANDVLTVNGADISAQLFRGSGGSVTLANDNHSSTESVVVTDKVTLNHGGAAVLETNKHGVTITGINTADGFHVGDNEYITVGVGSDLQFYHENSGNNSLIFNKTGDLYIQGNNGSGAAQTQIQINSNAEVDIKHQGNVRITTTGDGADITGTGSLKIPVGTEAQRPASPAQGDIRYNTTIKKFEGHDGTAWGGLGGGTEIDNIVETASATGVGTFVKADYRAASIRAQINQDGNYQVGRYLLIHDDTTVTMVEEAAIATGSMLGTFDGVINGSNIELKVTMGSAGIATVTAIIDKISV